MGSSPATGYPWWSADKLREALIEHDGNKTAVAETWNTSFDTINTWVQTHELEKYTTGNANTGLPEDIHEVA